MLTRCAIVNLSNGTVVNAVAFESVPVATVPGYGDGFRAIASDVAAPGWAWDGETFTPPSPAPAPLTTQNICLVGQARLLMGGGEISGIQTAVGFAAALEIDTAVYWIFFTQPQPDDDYGGLAQARGASGIWASVTDQTPEYVEIAVTNFSGSPVAPDELFITIQRAI